MAPGANWVYAPDPAEVSRNTRTLSDLLENAEESWAEVDSEELHQ